MNCWGKEFIRRVNNVDRLTDSSMAEALRRLQAPQRQMVSWGLCKEGIEAFMAEVRSLVIHF